MATAGALIPTQLYLFHLRATVADEDPSVRLQGKVGMTIAIPLPVWEVTTRLLRL